LARTGNGSILFDGHALAERGLVVVTVNYRLGRLGFLAHPWLSAESETGCSGNYGFMDQVAALKWVRDNIAAFGGDPRTVTIAGISAGSASTCLHMVSPLSKGLFHRALAVSGGFFGPVSENSGMFDRLLNLKAAETRGVRFTDAAGVRTVKEMRALPVERVMGVPVPSEPGPWRVGDLDFHVGNGVSDTAYPIVDGCVIPAPPRDIFDAGRHNDVPLLTGTPLNDASGLPCIDTLDAFHAYLDAEYGDLAPACAAVHPARSDAEAQIASGNLLADRVFGWQNWTWAKLAQQKGRSAVFYYDWKHAPFFDRDKHMEPYQGAVHGVEIPFLFDNLSALDWDWHAEDHRLATIMSDYCANFARTGDPNAPGLPLWPRLEGDTPSALAITSDPSAAPPAREARFGFLDRVWPSSAGEAIE
jgi:para-nitrobenzyl esterase